MESTDQDDDDVEDKDEVKVATDADMQAKLNDSGKVKNDAEVATEDTKGDDYSLIAANIAKW